MKLRVGWIIGNGEKISVWDHNWIPCKEGLRKPLSNISNPNITIKDWSINPIISNIKKLALNFAHMEFSYISKLLNSTAHLLAKHYYSSNRNLDRKRELLFLGVAGLIVGLGL